MPEGHVGLEALEIRRAQPARDAVQFGVVPGNRERNRRIEQQVEIVSVVGILPEIVAVEEEVLSDPLLQSGIELIALAGLNRHAGFRTENILGEPAVALSRSTAANFR